MRRPWGRNFVTNAPVVVLFRAALWTGLLWLLPKRVRDAWTDAAQNRIRAAWAARRAVA